MDRAKVFTTMSIGAVASIALITQRVNHARKRREKVHRACRDLVLHLVDDVLQHADLLHAEAHVHRRPQRLLGALLARDELVDARASARLFQPRVHQQHHRLGTACGHYAALYARCVLAAACSDSLAAAKQWLKQLRSPAAFWFSLRRQLGVLRARQRPGSSLWSRQAIEQLEVQRVHMEALLDDPHITSVPSISLREMKAGLLMQETVDELQAQFDACLQADDWVHAFVVGSGTHWVTILVNKCAGEVELLLVDSYNGGVLSPSPEELYRKCCERIYSSLPRYIRRLEAEGHSRAQSLVLLSKGRPYPDKVYSLQDMVEFVLDNWNDMRHTVELMRRCCTDPDATVASACVEAIVDGIVCSFEEAQLPASSAAQLAQPTLKRTPSFVGIEAYIQCGGEFCHPGYIGGLLLPRLEQLGREHCHEHVARKLGAWTTRVQAAIDEAKAQDGGEQEMPALVLQLEAMLGKLNEWLYCGPNKDDEN